WIHRERMRRARQAAAPDRGRHLAVLGTNECARKGCEMNSAATRTERTGWSGALGALAVGLALLSLTVGFGAVDLLSPWILHEGTQVSDVGYGTLAGILIPAGLLAQLHAPLRRIAGLQQLAL